MSFGFMSDFTGVYDYNWEPSWNSYREWEAVPTTIGPTTQPRCDRYDHRQKPQQKSLYLVFWFGLSAFPAPLLCCNL